MEKSVQLKDLVGVHILTGVDFEPYGRTFQSSYDGFYPESIVNFTIDGITYTAVEDKEDGYRSSMKEIFASDLKLKNTFHPVMVQCAMSLEPEACSSNGEYDQILQITDMETGKIILEVGTNHTDDYYPCFIASFSPQNMAINNIPPSEFTF